MDTQQLELMGRHRLVESLVHAGLDVAMPLRDRGVDLIAYTPGAGPGGFDAFPVQLKSFSGEGFSLHTKYAQVDRLVLAYVWRMNEPERSSILAMTYAEALSVAHDMGYTQTESWKKPGGAYSVTSAGTRLRDRLACYALGECGWQELRELLAIRADRLDERTLGAAGPAPLFIRWLERRGVAVRGSDGWLGWREEAERVLRDQAGSPDVDAARRCLAVHVRQDRMVEGHWGEMVARGEIQRLAATLAAQGRE